MSTKRKTRRWVVTVTGFGHTSTAYYTAVTEAEAIAKAHEAHGIRTQAEEWVDPMDRAKAILEEEPHVNSSYYCRVCGHTHNARSKIGREHVRHSTAAGEVS